MFEQLLPVVVVLVSAVLEITASGCVIPAFILL